MRLQGFPFILLSLNPPGPAAEKSLHCVKVLLSLTVGNIILKKAMGFRIDFFFHENFLKILFSSMRHILYKWGKKKISRSAFQLLTSDKHSSAARAFPCTVFYQTGIGPSILWQGVLHYKAHLSTVKGGFPKESHFTCRWEQPKERETGRTNAAFRNNDEKE